MSNYWEMIKKRPSIHEYRSGGGGERNGEGKTTTTTTTWSGDYDTKRFRPIVSYPLTPPISAYGLSHPLCVPGDVESDMTTIVLKAADRDVTTKTLNSVHLSAFTSFRPVEMIRSSIDLLWSDFSQSA